MAASAKKKNKKGKTLTLTDFLAEDGGGGGGPTYIPKPVSWADETDDLEGDVSTTWHSNDDDVYRAPPIDRSLLPTAPRAAREPNIDRSRLPKSPPYTAFLGNLPYDVTEESIKDFFRGLNISAVRLPREPTNPERLKGFGYAEFEDIDSLFQALSLNEESLGNRRIRVDVADQAQDKDRDDRCFGRDRDRFRDSERFESDWRARPAASESFDDYPPRRGDDGFGDRYRDRYDDRYRDGPRRDMDRGFGSRDRYDDRSRDYDRGYDSRLGSGRRAFGSGYRRDDDYRGGSDRYEDRYERRDDRLDRWNSRDDYGRDDFRREDRGPTQRPKLNLKPRSAPKEEEATVTPAPQSSRAASIFGEAKPVDTAAREREVEERLQKEQEKLQRQLEDDKRIERRPRERHPSWRSEENQERSRTGSESSQTGTSGPPGTSVGTGPTGRTATRRRESEKSLENEPVPKDDDVPASPPRPRDEKQAPKVVPAPPPKENAWAKRSSLPPARSEPEQHSPPSTPSAPSPPLEDGAPPKNTPRRGEENKPEGSSKGRSGSNGRGPPESERKESRKEPDTRAASEPKRLEENPPSFSHASKYAALAMDGEDEGDDEEGAE
ncbi:eukaryotic translation initiation factor 4B isoform X3 [Colius striatus]|uniref:eukaryotic translation initiation factor 4B isoform X3 n=1 Tax=Colius striatus TaxID=57412 RepID=UPI002B1D605C|nr:eukaryotic translation initiation factor 4B isoform X3 [Colius striatus]